MTDGELRVKVDQLHGDLGFLKKLGLALVGALFSLAGVGVFALVQIGQYKERVDTMQVQIQELKGYSRDNRSTLSKMERETSDTLSRIQIEIATSMPKSQWLLDLGRQNEK